MLAPCPGTRLGVYEVVSALGAGGMGEVYRAHDTALGHDVPMAGHSWLVKPEAESIHLNLSLQALVTPP